MPQMPDQIALHDRAGATHRAMGARTSARGGAAPTRREPTSDAPEARDGRAPLRHDQGAHGRDALPDKDTAESRRRDGAQRSRLQSDAGYEHRRYQAADGGDPDMKQLRTLRSSLQLFGPPSARYHTTKTLGCAKTPAVAPHVETSPGNCIPESQIILYTRGSMPCWRIVSKADIGQPLMLQ